MDLYDEMRNINQKIAVAQEKIKKYKEQIVQLEEVLNSYNAVASKVNSVIKRMLCVVEKRNSIPGNFVKYHKENILKTVNENQFLSIPYEIDDDKIAVKNKIIDLENEISRIKVKITNMQENAAQIQNLIRIMESGGQV